MTAPVFEEFAPASDCGCPGCARARHGSRRSPRRLSGGAVVAPAACGLVVVAAASAVLGAAAPAAALTTGRPAVHRPPVPGGGDSDTPQGGRSPLHGRTGKPADPSKIPTTTRSKIITRAKTWVTAQVPYSMSAYWSDGYRQDCSGYVSMAWGLPGNEWTGSLGDYGVKITKEELEPGDILLYHNPDNPEKGSHVVIFGGWTDYTHATYTVYEQTPPHARSQPTPYPYWSNADKYVPYRYKGVIPEASDAQPAGGKAQTAYPGVAAFGPGADNPYVALLGRMLAARGGRAYYPLGPGRAWTEADRRATRAFQLAQGWNGAETDGLPGPRTWHLLVTGRGRDIAPAAAAPLRVAPHGAPGFPGRAAFLPGAENDHVTRLGRRLVQKGFGGFYAKGPGPRWGEADRRAVAAFQRAQGWRGGAADGYPGPETWRRLFADAGPGRVTSL
ncbi:peptidoglycan-binding protein [Streptomyces sp. FXJ1.172]|uniref:peptidoglycan-binding protein n=1 Tax=Streptomyces sp. FXJ1.172 TaxID=710705 RepID=UPI0007CF6659|nr:peptidoglycan-binding protein [Streptomyces sp. FXJ1.172]WEO97217.1 peptidoglycan-binding protein [Streptomyces sp. FXJ1.172]